MVAATHHAADGGSCPVSARRRTTSGLLVPLVAIAGA